MPKNLVFVFNIKKKSIFVLSERSLRVWVQNFQFFISSVRNLCPFIKKNVKTKIFSVRDRLRFSCGESLKKYLNF